MNSGPQELKSALPPRPALAEVAAVLALLAALGLLYRPVVEWVLEGARGSEYLEHVPLLPLVSAWLLYYDRDRIRAAWESRGAPDGGSGRPHRQSVSRYALFAGGLLLNLRGQLTGIRTLEGVSLLVVLLGLAMLVGGPRVARLAQFPVLFLSLGLPTLGMLADRWTAALQLGSAAGAASLLGMLGIPVDRHGVSLHTPRYEFLVAVPCSGLKSAISLLTIGVLISHLLPGLSRTRRGLLCVLVAPVALFANEVRIVAVILLGYFFGPAIGEGFLHTASGLVVLLLSSCALLVCGRFMAGSGEPTDASDSRTVVKSGGAAVGAAMAARANPGPWPPLPVRRIAASALAVGAAWALGLLLIGPETPAAEFQSARVIKLPSQLAGWNGKPLPVQLENYRVLSIYAAGSSLYQLPATSVRSRGKMTPKVQVIALYNWNPRDFHDMEECLMYAGWKAVGEEERTIRGGQQAVDLKVLTVERGDQRMQQACFYRVGAETRANRAGLIARFALGRLLRRTPPPATKMYLSYNSAVLRTGGGYIPEFESLVLSLAKLPPASPAAPAASSHRRTASTMGR